MSTYDERRGLPSCSALYRLENCPASFHLGKLAAAAGVVPASGPEADSGTRIHKFLETDSDDDFERLTSDERETASICVTLREKVIREWSGNSALDVERHNERRLGMTRMGRVVDVAPTTAADLIVTGMADMIVIDPENKRGLILDYKTGRGDVEEAKDNAQLRGLVVLAANRWKVENVRVAIIQPINGQPSVADFDKASLGAAELWLEDVVTECDKPNLTPRAGDWCQYCPARCFDKNDPGASVCHVLRDKATGLPEVVATGEELDNSPMIARALALPADHLSRLLKGRKLIGWYVNAIEAAAKMRLERGESVPGYELREKNGKRKIADTDAASRVLAPLLASAEGGATAALLRSAVLNPPKIQEEIQRASGKKSARLYNMTQKDAKQHMALALGDLLHIPTSKVLVETGAAIEGVEDE